MRIDLKDKEKTISFLRECLDTLEEEDVEHIEGSLSIESETEVNVPFTGCFITKPTGRRIVNVDLEYFVNLPKPEPIDYPTVCICMKIGDGCLVRDNDDDGWRANVYLGMEKTFTDDAPFTFKTPIGSWNQCLPYIGYEEYTNTNKNPVI